MFRNRFIYVLFNLDLTLRQVIHRSIHNFLQTGSDVNPAVCRLKEIVLADIVDVLVVADAIPCPSHLTQAVFDKFMLERTLVLDVLSGRRIHLLLQLLGDELKSVLGHLEVLQVRVCLGGVIINCVHHALGEIDHLLLGLFKFLEPDDVRLIPNDEDPFASTSNLDCDLVHGEELA